MPMASETTSSCSTEKLKVGSPWLMPACRPKMFSGTMPCRNAVQLPVFSGSAAEAASTEVPTPGLSTSATRMPPRTTDRNEVTANQMSVLTARRAAPVTLRRLATEVITAATTSGGTISFSSWT